MEHTSTEQFLPHFLGKQLFCSKIDKNNGEIPNGDVEASPWHHTDFDKLAKLNHLERKPLPRAIYFCPNELDQSLDPGRKRTKKMFVKARAIWCEDDNVRDEPRTDWPIEPNIIVNSSPGKYHYYWLTSTTSVEEWNAVMQTMVVQYGCDNNAKDIVRVMRLPGFYHLKDIDNPHMATYTVLREKPYDWAAIKGAFPPSDVTHTSKDKPSSKSESTGPASVGQLNKDYEEGHRHGPSASMAMKLVNKGFEFDDALQILMQMYPDVSERQHRESLSTGYTKLEEENTARNHHAIDDNYTFQVDDQYTDMPMPPGGLSKIVDFVMSIMRYPNKDIAIPVAEHIVSTFGGGHWHLMGNTTTRKRIVLAAQGTGKSTIGVALDKIFTFFDSPVPTKGNMPRLSGTRSYIGSDSFSFSVQHKQIEDHRVRSFIVNEAGAAGSSKSGDIGTLKAYQLDVLSRKASSSYEPKKYSANNKSIELKTVYGGVWVYFHESTISSYIDLLTNSQAFINGDLSRSDLFFINPKIDIDNINMNHSFQTLTEEQAKILSKLISDFRSLGLAEGTNPAVLKGWESIDFSEIEDELAQFEIDNAIARNEANAMNDEKRLSGLVRRHEKVYCTVLLCAIADAAYTDDDQMVTPKATKEHLAYALERQEAIDKTVNYHITGGVFSDKLDSIVKEVVTKIRAGGSTAKRLKCTWNNEKDAYQIRASYIKSLLNTSAKLSGYVESVHRGNKENATNSIIRDMMSSDLLFGGSEKNSYLVNRSIVDRDAYDSDEFFKPNKRGRADAGDKRPLTKREKAFHKREKYREEHNKNK